FENTPVKAWKGPYQGTGIINGSDWLPYQIKDFCSPAFPGYPSGHSGFSTASARVLARLFGSDEYYGCYTITEGTLPLERKIVQGQPGWIPGVTDVPN